MKNLVCPICKCDFVHPHYVECKDGNDSYQTINKTRIDRSGFSHSYEIKDHDYRARTLGVINVGFRCENEHIFTISYNFHKGSTYVIHK